VRHVTAVVLCSFPTRRSSDLLSVILFLVTEKSQLLMFTMSEMLDRLLNWYQTSCKISSASSEFLTLGRMKAISFEPYFSTLRETIFSFSDSDIMTDSKRSIFYKTNEI